MDVYVSDLVVGTSLYDWEIAISRRVWCSRYLKSRRVLATVGDDNKAKCGKRESDCSGYGQGLSFVR